MNHCEKCRNYNNRNNRNHIIDFCYCPYHAIGKVPLEDWRNKICLDCSNKMNMCQICGCNYTNEGETDEGDVGDCDCIICVDIDVGVDVGIGVGVDVLNSEL